MLKQSIISFFLCVKRICQIPCQPTKRCQYSHANISADNCWRKLVCETDSLLKYHDTSLKFFALCLREYSTSGSKAGIVRKISTIVLVIPVFFVQYAWKTWAAK